MVLYDGTIKIVFSLLLVPKQVIPFFSGFYENEET